MIKSMLYRLKGVRKIEELDDQYIFECLKCLNKLIVHKNFGNMIVTCPCGHTCNIYTGANSHTTVKPLEIPRELKIFNCMISEYVGRYVIKGRYINQSIYFLNEPFGAFAIGNNQKEVLFFPSLHVEQPKTTQVIEPFEEGEFCHYLSDEEVASINKSETNPLKLQFLEFKKSRSRA